VTRSVLPVPAWASAWPVGGTEGTEGPRLHLCACK
jgi:hypothetical protein